MEHFHSLHVYSQEVKEVILALRGALITNARQDLFSMGLQRRMRPDAFISEATEAQCGFSKNARDLLLSKGVNEERPGIARNIAIAVRVVNKIWPLAGHEIIDSYKRKSSAGCSAIKPDRRSKTCSSELESVAERPIDLSIKAATTRTSKGHHLDTRSQ